MSEAHCDKCGQAKWLSRVFQKIEEQVNQLTKQRDELEKKWFQSNKERNEFEYQLNEALKALEIAANQLEGVSLGIQTHGQNINVQFFIKTYAHCASVAREAIQKIRGQNDL